MGALVGIGDPGVTATEVRVGDADMLVEGELYRYVAARTIDEPTKNAVVMGYANNATDARNEIMMESEVAKPFL